MSQPIQLLIKTGPPLPGLKQPTVAQLARGMQLTLPDQSIVPIQETLKPDWLSEAGLKPGQKFELEGYFEVSREETYQFQVWHTGSLTLSVDNTKLYSEEKGNFRQRFVPVPLQKGMHHLVLSGKAGDQSRMRILFGGPGMVSLDGKMFRHLTK